MESFAGKLAVVTGGGSGMGRGLVRQLAAAGCSVATCDLDLDNAAETVDLALAGAPEGVVVTAHRCDVGIEAQVLGFRDEVVAQHDASHVELLFNNAGIGGGGSMVTDQREAWERTFGIDFFGVYFCIRAFLPLLIASEEAALINTSSVNGFFASLGPGIPHTAYSAAKFAVKGLSEALIEDLRVNAPHVSVAVVMPGHIGTNIIHNSRAAIRSSEPGAAIDEMSGLRSMVENFGIDISTMSDHDIEQMATAIGDGFRDTAPIDGEQAAAIILDAVRAGKWRILVGDDARALDEAVRADPEHAYDHGGKGFAAMSSLTNQG